jgi:membrane-associated phospholipid phosphatase
MKKIFFSIGGLSLLFFTLFSYGIKKGMLKSLDFNVTVKLQDIIDKSSHLRFSNLISEIMEGSTFFASPEFSIIVVLFITLLIFIKFSKRKINVYAVLIPILFLFMTLFEIYGKTVIHHPAPPFFMIKNPTTIFPKYTIIENFSYPSGHAARAVFISLCIIIFLKFKINRKNILIFGLLFLYIICVSISRIYLGHHWFTDIVGGISIGISFGSFAYLIKE